MTKYDLPEVVNFLHLNLNLPNDSIQLAVKQSHSNYNRLPVVLWQYGLVTLPELDKIYDWFESYIY
jgi:hypothetical protein